MKSKEKNQEEIEGISARKNTKLEKKQSAGLLSFFSSKDKESAQSYNAWELPQNCAQDDIGFELLREDGIIKVHENLYGRCIQFEDVNYQGALADTQRLIHESMCDLYNSLPENCAIQLFMLSRKMHTEEVSNILYMPLADVDDGYNDLRQEQNSIIDIKMTTTSQNVRRTHCFIVTCEELTFDRAKVALNRACSGIERKLRDIESEFKILDGTEWLSLINHITNPKDPENLISYEDLAAMPGSSAIDLVSPPNITTYGTRGFSMGEYFYKTLYVSKYSNTVRDDFFSQIAELSYNIVISMHAKPYDQADAIDMVNAKRNDLNVQRRQQIKKNPALAYQSEKDLPGNLGEKLETANETRIDLLQREQSLFEQSIVIMIFASSLEELEGAQAEIERITKTFSYRVSPLVDMQLMGLQSALPIGNASIPISRSLMSAALSNFSPFTADELMQPDGLYGGINQLSKNVISYDRRLSTAPNGFILGKPGRGKSVNAKYQIIQLLMRDKNAKCLVIDPEGEYETLCNILPDAQHVKITNGGNVHINPLDISDQYSDEGASPLEFKTDFIISLVDMMTQGMTSEQINIVDRCCRFIYQDYFSSHDEKSMPILQNLYEEIKRQPEDAAQSLATNFERFVEGSMNVFNAHTNVSLAARLIVFDIKDLQKNLSPVALLILLDQVWNFVTRGRATGNNTWFFVDEMQLLKDSEYAVNYLDQLFTRSRKWGAIPTGITQNVERVLQVNAFRMMIANSDFLVILGQSKTDADALSNVLKLSDEQTRAVRTAGIGEGLLIVNGKVLQFENRLPKTISGKPSQIYRAVTTKLSDLVEMGMTKSE